MMRRLPLSVLAVAVSLLALGGGAVALATHAQSDATQTSSLLAERVVEYRTGRVHSLNAKVGPVNIHSVEFTDRGRGSTPGGIGGILRGGAGGSSDASTTLRAHFVVDNPLADEWQVTFTLEFLDRSGKLIDRAVRREGWEGEAKPYDFDHSILEYVVPSIDRVRIKLEGRLD